MSFPSKQRAFTLTELLICIGIIALLTALLVPASGTLRERARTSQCVGHLRAVSSALRLYIAEGSTLSPRKRSGYFYSFLGGSVPGEETWSAMLYRGGYLESKQTYRCPAVVPTTSLTVANWYYEVYGMNMVTLPGISIGDNYSNGTHSGGVYHLPTARVEQPSRLITLADSRAAALSAQGHEVQRFRLLQGSAGAPADGISLRHQGRANVAFLDGHIRSVNAEELLALRNAPYAPIPFYSPSGAYNP